MPQLITQTERGTTFVANHIEAKNKLQQPSKSWFPTPKKLEKEKENYYYCNYDVKYK